MKVTIDGPAGAGKSTVSKLLATKLGYLYLDSGALYRAYAIWIQGDRVGDFKPVYYWEDGKVRIFLGRKDISNCIREEEVAGVTSKLAQDLRIRERLTELQREIILDNDVVLDGRDAGTVVCPDAEYKFFLSAKLDDRINRRKKDTTSQDSRNIRKMILARDLSDSSRKFGRMKPAKEAILINTSGKTAKEVLALILKSMSNLGK